MFIEILSAFCLILVLQGILPFLNPAGYKRAIRLMLEIPDDQLRILALSSMIGGVALLALIR